MCIFGKKNIANIFGCIIQINLLITSKFYQGLVSAYQLKKSDVCGILKNEAEQFTTISHNAFWDLYIIYECDLIEQMSPSLQSKLRNHDIINSIESYEPMRNHKTVMLNPWHVLNKRKPEKKSAVIDVLVVVDYSIYLRELAERNGDVSKTVMDLKTYYTLLMTMVDIRFSHIKSDELKMRVKPASIIVMQSEDSSWWEEAYHPFLSQDSSKRTLDPEEVLFHFRKWLKLKNDGNSLPEYDHAVAFVGHKMVKPGSDLPSTGLAYLGTMCKSSNGWSASVVEETGGFLNVGVVAHEMAHSLGASHDGFNNAQDCSPGGSYIMSTSSSNMNIYHKSYFQFSPCSIQAFNNFLRTEQANCLYDGVNESNSHKLTTNYGSEQQCQDVFGPKSGACDNGYDPTICVELWCIHPKSREKCITTAFLHAAFGTQCGKNRVCKLGKCINKQKVYKFL